MSAAVTTTPDTIDAFSRAYDAAGQAATELRLAYSSVDHGERVVALAVAADREAARVAFVAGREHTELAGVQEARDVLSAAHEHLGVLQAADAGRMSALSASARALPSEQLAEAIGQLVDAAGSRVDLAVDELGAARRQLAQVVSMVGWLDGAGSRTRLGEAAVLTRVAGLVGRNGEAFSFADVEGALRAMGDTARDVLAAFANRPKVIERRVPEAEMLAWHIATGGSFSDSTSEIVDHYMEGGPRRAEAQLDARQLDSGRTRDQRTWTGG